jgi:hypothetical protein
VEDAIFRRDEKFVQRVSLDSAPVSPYLLSLPTLPASLLLARWPRAEREMSHDSIDSGVN